MRSQTPRRFGLTGTAGREGLVLAPATRRNPPRRLCPIGTRMRSPGNLGDAPLWRFFFHVSAPHKFNSSKTLSRRDHIFLSSAARNGCRTCPALNKIRCFSQFFCRKRSCLILQGAGCGHADEEFSFRLDAVHCLTPVQGLFPVIIAPWVGKIREPNGGHRRGTDRARLAVYGAGGAWDDAAASRA